jgi:outer membrane biosynthesis protein TonB
MISKSHPVPHVPAVLVIAIGLAACGESKKGAEDADADVGDPAVDTLVDVPVDTAPETVVDVVSEPDVIDEPVDEPVADPEEDPTPEPEEDPEPDVEEDPASEPEEDPEPDVDEDPASEPVDDTTTEPSVDTAPDSTGCPDDSYEDNDTDTTASTGITTGSYTSLRVCPSDDDYYSVTVSPGDAVTVALLFSDAEGDVDVEIVDSTGTTVAYSDSITDNEWVTYTSSAGGTYLIYVYLYADSGASIGNDYDMDVRLGAPPVCSEDTYEDNDTDTTASAITAGTISSLRVCPGDDDYFTTRVLSGQTITVDLTFLHAEGDVDVELVDAAGTTVDGSYTTTDNETVTDTATRDGAYIIYIYLYSDDGMTLGNDYSIDLTIS